MTTVSQQHRTNTTPWNHYLNMEPPFHTEPLSQHGTNISTWNQYYNNMVPALPHGTTLSQHITTISRKGINKAATNTDARQHSSPTHNSNIIINFSHSFIYYLFTANTTCAKTFPLLHRDHSADLKLQSSINWPMCYWGDISTTWSRILQPSNTYVLLQMLLQHCPQCTV